jgi:hypothetical protein
MDSDENDADLHDALQRAQTQLDAEILQVRDVQLSNIDIHMKLCKAQMDGGNSDESINAARHQLRSCQIALALLQSCYKDMKKVLTGLGTVHATEASLEDSKDTVKIACNVACMTRKWAADEYALCKQQIAAAEKAIDSRMCD